MARARAGDDGGDDRSSARINGRLERREDRWAVRSAPSSSSSSPISFFLLLLSFSLCWPAAGHGGPVELGAGGGAQGRGSSRRLGAGRVAIPGELGAWGAGELGAAAGDPWRGRGRGRGATGAGALGRRGRAGV